MNQFNLWKFILDASWLVILALIFYHFWNKRRVLVDAQGWLKAKGRITSFELIRVAHGVWPKIEYAYQVCDQDLTGHYLFLDTAHNSPNSKYARRIAYQTALAYKDQLDVDVYYNPNRPEESALDVTMPIKLTAILIVIGMLLVLQVTMLVWRYC
jgi:hypothetical protein